MLRLTKEQIQDKFKYYFFVFLLIIFCWIISVFADDNSIMNFINSTNQTNVISKNWLTQLNSSSSNSVQYINSSISFKDVKPTHHDTINLQTSSSRRKGYPVVQLTPDGSIVWWWILTSPTTMVWDPLLSSLNKLYIVFPPSLFDPIEQSNLFADLNSNVSILNSSGTIFKIVTNTDESNWNSSLTDSSTSSWCFTLTDSYWDKYSAPDWILSSPSWVQLQKVSLDTWNIIIWRWSWIWTTIISDWINCPGVSIWSLCTIITYSDSSYREYKIDNSSCLMTVIQNSANSCLIDTILHWTISNLWDATNSMQLLQNIDSSVGCFVTCDSNYKWDWNNCIPNITPSLNNCIWYLSSDSWTGSFPYWTITIWTPLWINTPLQEYDSWSSCFIQCDTNYAFNWYRCIPWSVKTKPAIKECVSWNYARNSTGITWPNPISSSYAWLCPPWQSVINFMSTQTLDMYIYSWSCKDNTTSVIYKNWNCHDLWNISQTVCSNNPSSCSKPLPSYPDPYSKVSGRLTSTGVWAWYICSSPLSNFNISTWNCEWVIPPVDSNSCENIDFKDQPEDLVNPDHTSNVIIWNPVQPLTKLQWTDSTQPCFVQCSSGYSYIDWICKSNIPKVNNSCLPSYLTHGTVSNKNLTTKPYVIDQTINSQGACFVVCDSWYIYSHISKKCINLPVADPNSSTNFPVVSEEPYNINPFGIVEWENWNLYINSSWDNSIHKVNLSN